MEKLQAVEVFSQINMEFALKYSEAWVKKLRADPEMALNWVQAIIKEDIDERLAMVVVNRVKVNEKYVDYPPNLNAFVFECTQVKYGNIIDHDTAYQSFCTGKAIEDSQSAFLTRMAAEAVGVFRLKTQPFLFKSFNTHFNELKTKLISGELDVEYKEFLRNRAEKVEVKPEQQPREVVKPSEMMNRLNRISSLIKKEIPLEE
ncbi:hypothetical protein ACTG16_23920 [Aeromonas sp. 23P]|uniref:hypothetical protein n=1 Tax=Aeromonas sp. 23P TaxID=3452716 RepID=UPI003F7A81FF|nr:hypothetical protein [Aeromonas veronii]